MTQVIGDAPAAVLLVDLASRQVVHTNTVADHLAPHVSLPVATDVWSDAAALRDVDGQALSDTDHPLSRVARSEPVAGQAVSAARVSELGRQREPLWVVALPMAGAPMLTDHALVVLLPLRAHSATQAAVDAAQQQAELRERAVLATGMSFTVVDAHAEDLPLVWVNPAFSATTGYTFDEAVGRNCRFLQGPGTDPAAPAIMREAIAAGRDVNVTVLNYRKDGSAFWNQLSMSPIHGPDGDLTHFVGIQTDVTGRIQADEERDRALRAETRARQDAEEARTEADQARTEAEQARIEAEQARAESEQARVVAETAQARLALLAEATSQLAITLDVASCRQRLLELVVPELGDWALLISTERGVIDSVTAKHVNPARTGDLHAYIAALRQALVPGSARQTLLGAAPARLLSDYDSPRSRQERERWVNDAAVLDLSDALGAASAVFVALPGRRSDSSINSDGGRDGGSDGGSGPDGGPEGDSGIHNGGGVSSDDVMILVRGTHRPRHSEDDLNVAVDLARRAGLILDNARLYEQQHTIATTLQDSLLPALPDIPGVRAAARYRAATSGAQVGGDFYELIALPGSAIGLAIGDVVGHDVLAAAAMGHLRGLLRACAWDAAASSNTGRVLERVDELLAGLEITTLATLIYARLVPAAGGGWGMTHSNAGHPPLLLRDPDGNVSVLNGENALSDEQDLLLGVAPQQRRTTSHHLQPGSMLLAYTDGLIERRGEHLTHGLQQLSTAFAAGPADPDALCSTLLERMGSEGDDTAVLALALPHPKG